jgi:integrase
MSQKMSLKKPRNWETFEKERLEKMSDSIIHACTLAKARFDEFLYSNYDGMSTEKFIVHIRSLDEDERDDELFQVLQSWVDWLSDTFDLNSASTRQAFSRLNKFLWYCRIKISSNDIKDEIEWPEDIQEERYAPTDDEFSQIVSNLGWRNRGFCIGLSCPGMRPVELMGTQKKHYSFVNGRWMIEIPYYLTKKRISRTTGFSKEFNPFITKLLKERSDEDFVWTKRRQVPESFFQKYSHLKDEKAKIKAIKRFATDMLTVVRISFNRKLKTLGLDMKYESTGEHKITFYSFRGRFVTRALKILDGDVVHAIVGHGAYLQTYQRRTIQEKAELIDVIESDIMIGDSARKKAQIEKMKLEKNESVKVKNEFDDYKKETDAKMDRFEKMIDEKWESSKKDLNS